MYLCEGAEDNLGTQRITFEPVGNFGHAVDSIWVAGKKVHYGECKRNCVVSGH
jgi:hypothetical protein